MKKSNIVIDNSLQRIKRTKQKLQHFNEIHCILEGKERARLEELIMCPLKLCVTKDLRLKIKGESGEK